MVYRFQQLKNRHSRNTILQILPTHSPSSTPGLGAEICTCQCVFQCFIFAVAEKNFLESETGLKVLQGGVGEVGALVFDT